MKLFFFLFYLFNVPKNHDNLEITEGYSLNLDSYPMIKYIYTGLSKKDKTSEKK